MYQTFFGGYYTFIGEKSDFSSAVGTYCDIGTGSPNCSSFGFDSNIGNNCSGVSYVGYQCSGGNNLTGVSAFGWQARSRVPYTTNIRGPQIISKTENSAQNENFWRYAGVNTVLTTDLIDFKVTGATVITIPNGAHFCPDEVGLYITACREITGLCSVSFGNTGVIDKLVPETLCDYTLRSGFRRQKFADLSTVDGEQNLVGAVISPAVGEALSGRFYFRGLLIEDQ